MNTKNNKRRKETRERIERAFISLLQTEELSRITVSELCKATGFNRSTFYANYADIYDLADKIRDKLEAEVNALYENDLANSCGDDYLKLFRHIKDNPLFYLTYFKLGYDSRHTINPGDFEKNQRYLPKEHLAYHIEFHKAGLNAIIKKWLAGGCVESPETMAEILRVEYGMRR